MSLHRAHDRNRDLTLLRLRALIFSIRITSTITIMSTTKF